MIDKIEKTIVKYNMLNCTGERILAGLSGGADSVSLVLVLKKLGYDVYAIHINHNLRGEESMRDERFCEDFCKNHNISYAQKSVDVMKYCNENGLSVETGAREIRYKIFDEYAKGCKIATAHNADDCLETALFNLSRGTGIKGICGIPAVRDNIIRPLIEVSRAEIEEFLISENQSYVVDSSNLSNDYSRNKIRHGAVAVLREINSGLVNNYLRLRENLEADNDYLANQSNQIFQNIKVDGGYEIFKLADIHKAIKNRIYCEILNENNIEVSQTKVETLENLRIASGKVNISNNHYVICQNGFLSFIKKAEPVEEIRIPITINNKYLFFDRQILLEMKENSIHGNNINSFFTIPVMDCDKIKGGIYLRNRRAGDKIKLAGRGFTSSVKKLLNENILVEKRDKLAFLEDEEGLIFVEGFGPAQRVCCDAQTKSVIEIKIFAK